MFAVKGLLTGTRIGPARNYVGGAELCFRSGACLTELEWAVSKFGCRCRAVFSVLGVFNGDRIGPARNLVPGADLCFLSGLANRRWNLAGRCRAVFSVRGLFFLFLSFLSAPTLLGKRGLVNGPFTKPFTKLTKKAEGRRPIKKTS